MAIATFFAQGRPRLRESLGDPLPRPSCSVDDIINPRVDGGEGLEVEVWTACP